jgi:gamma-glutamyltranspeptidase/glutathione hydrolase
LDENGNVKNNGKANQLGGLAVAVPGTVAGMEKAFALYGSGNLTRKAVMTPAIELAERGFHVGSFQYNQTLEKYASMQQYEAISKYYLKPNGSAYKTGEIFSNPDLGKTLRLIAEGGADAFYTGDVANAMLSEIQKLGGVMEQSDLDNYEAKLREPITGTYRGYQIISCPPPSSGGTHIVQIFNVLENFDVGSMEVNSSEYIHLWSETLKAVFADREKYMADTDFVEDVPLSGLTDKEYAKTIADRITDTSQSWMAGDPTEYVHDSTTSFSVVDKYGNMVTVTQTLECSFGSCVAVPGYGFVLNDEMHDFSTNPNSANCVQGKKHPLSSMSPTVVLKEDGSPFMTLGTPAGLRIYTTLAQIISKVIDHGMDLQTAIDCARIYDNGSARGIEYETGCKYPITAETIAELSAMGHVTTQKGNWKIYFGGVQGVMYEEDGTLFGAADPRRDGKALGY